MTARPILMSGPMVRALLAGTKSQTRRGVRFDDHAGRWNEAGYHYVADDGIRRHAWTPRSVAELIRCPYGVPGDTLWVREAWRCHAVHDHVPGGELGGTNPAAVQYIADANRQAAHPWGRMRHARFMPRWASRITLEITSVRVEKLQDISEADCWAEGIDAVDGMFDDEIHAMAKRIPGKGFEDAVPTYACLWESINGARSWDGNPYVWVIEFKRVQS